MKPSGLVCWKCGTGLDTRERISRLSLCPVCRSDLHVCRLCRYYDPHALGECRHERAERILDKELANFCTYFRPRPDAHHPAPRSASEAARAELDALFGSPVEPGMTEADGSEHPQVTADHPDDPHTAADRAREELNALFGKKPGT